MDNKKIILITGSSSGFGNLMVKSLAKKGHKVYASMRQADSKNAEKKKALKDWNEENKTDIEIIELDVTNDESVKNAIEHVIQNSDKIDVVVNNAGIGNYGATEGYDIDQIKQIFEVNVFGPMRVIKEALPFMRKQQSGLIIQISSILGRTVIPYIGPYSGTKFAVEGISESLAEEVKGLGIDVCIIEPGGYPTNFGQGMLNPKEDLTQEYGESIKKASESMNQFMEQMQGPNAPNPQDVADAVVSLVDAESGNRPRRTPVGGDEIQGAKAINDVFDNVQAQLLKGFGLD